MKLTSKKIFISLFAFITCAILALTLCSCGGKKSNSSSSSNSSSTNNSKFSESNFKETDQAEIVVKNYGTIKIGLDANSAPETVQNFKELVSQGFYNGLTFHRIIKDFVAQGGDPKGDGTGGSDKNIKGEFTENGVNNYLAHTRGALSMARSSDPDSASSQFFIVHQTTSKNSSALDGKYCCFGYVTSGMEIVDKIIADANPTDNNGTIERSQQPIIESIKLI